MHAHPCTPPSLPAHPNTPRDPPLCPAGPAGTTPDQPIPILSLPFQHTGRLLRPGASRPSPLPGNTTLQELQGSSRWGAVAYFELDNPQRLSLGVKLCLVGQRRGQEVQLAVVIDSVVKW